MTKKLLYIAPVIIDLERLNGVSKKILNQFKVFSECFKAEMISYGPDCLYYFHEGTIDKIPLGKLNRRLKLYSFLINELAINNYNCIYIRYHLSDILFIYVLRRLKTKINKIVIEIPSYPYKHELLRFKNGLIRYIGDLSARSFLKLYVGRIITYSPDSIIYGIKTINTINGIIYDDVTPVSKKERFENEINLISVSVTMDCHGYDRLIEGINNYYMSNGNANIVYHLVGSGDEINRYKDLVARYNLENHVIIYGFKTGSELDAIYQYADIAINSIAIHRIGLETESTIKSKEYAAKGLPMISSYDIDTFSTFDNLKYVLKVSPDESPISVDEIIQFYKRLYFEEIQDISSDIRNAARVKSDMRTTLGGAIEYFNI